jgi:hypothetical protein
LYAQTSPRRLLFLSILAALLGAAGGGAAWVLLHLIGLLTNLLYATAARRSRIAG